ncbi:MAG: hypothetical protein WBD22_00180 [Pyrinomonadaceae bacterium]
MKRCPECRRDYYDDTLLYCLDDGNVLLEGPASFDEPATAILSEPQAIATGRPTSEAPTRPHIHTTDQTTIARATEAELRAGSGEISKSHSLSVERSAKPQGMFGGKKGLIIAGIVAVCLIGGFFIYRYINDGQINSIAVLPFSKQQR